MIVESRPWFLSGAEHPFKIILAVRPDIGPLGIALERLERRHLANDPDPTILEQRLRAEVERALLQPAVVIALAIRQREIKWILFRRERRRIKASAVKRIVNPAEMLLPVVIPIGAAIRDELVLWAGRLAYPEHGGPGSFRHRGPPS